MQHPRWPVSVILSGMPQLRDLLNMDPQLARRFTPVHFVPLAPETDLAAVSKLVGSYAGSVDLSLKVDLQDRQFTCRLIHAAAGQFGILIELVVGAIEIAMTAGRDCLLVDDFGEAFARRSGCVPDSNPFFAEDYTAINARLLLLGAMQEPVIVGVGRHR